MSEDELRRAVTEPARLAGLRLEPGLVDVVLGEVAGEPGALPLLSHALRATWERRDGRTLTDRRLPRERRRRLGGRADGGRARRDGPPRRSRLLRNVFLRLTELGEGVEDTRRRVPIDELVPEDASADAGRALLDRFADARLVTLGEGTAEVAHEVLIREWPTLRGWLEEDREGLRAAPPARRRRAHLGRRRPRAHRPLPRHPARRALEWAQAHPDALNAAERAFLDARRRRVERERRAQLRANRRLRGPARRRRRAARGRRGGRRARARRESGDARDSLLTADAQRLGAQALVDDRLDRSLLFFFFFFFFFFSSPWPPLRAIGRTSTSSTVFRAQTPCPLVALHRLEHRPRRFTRFAFSPDGKRLAVAVSTGAPEIPVPTATRLYLLDMPSGDVAWQRKYPLQSFQNEAQVEFASKTTLVTSARRGKTLLWDATAGRIERRFDIGGPFAVSPDGRQAAIAANNPDPADPTTALVMLDLRTGEQLELPAAPARTWIISLAFTPDGHKVVTGSTDAAVRVWDAASGAIPQTFTGAALRPEPGGGPRRPHRRHRRGERQRGGVGPLRGAAAFAGVRMELAGSDLLTTPCFVIDPRGAVMATSQADGTVALIDIRDRKLSRHPARTHRARGGRARVLPRRPAPRSGWRRRTGRALGRVEPEGRARTSGRRPRLLGCREPGRRAPRGRETGGREPKLTRRGARLGLGPRALLSPTGARHRQPLLQPRRRPARGGRLLPGRLDGEGLGRPHRRAGDSTPSAAETPVRSPSRPTGACSRPAPAMARSRS